jgi:hypothetical protein
MPLVLERFLAPLSPDSLCDTYWDRRPVHVPGTPRKAFGWLPLASYGAIADRWYLDGRSAVLTPPVATGTASFRLALPGVAALRLAHCSLGVELEALETLPQFAEAATAIAAQLTPVAAVEVSALALSTRTEVPVRCRAGQHALLFTVEGEAMLAHRPPAGAAADDASAAQALRPGDLTYLPRGWRATLTAAQELVLLLFHLQPIDWVEAATRLCRAELGRAELASAAGGGTAEPPAALLALLGRIVPDAPAPALAAQLRPAVPQPAPAAGGAALVAGERLQWLGAAFEYQLRVASDGSAVGAVLRPPHRVEVGSDILPLIDSLRQRGRFTLDELREEFDEVDPVALERLVYMLLRLELIGRSPGPGDSAPAAPGEHR